MMVLVYSELHLSHFPLDMNYSATYRSLYNHQDSLMIFSVNRSFSWRIYLVRQESVKISAG